MKIRLKSTINALTNTKVGMCEVQLSSKGTVDNVPISAKEVTLESTLLIKQLIGAQLKLGSNINITIDIDEPEES
jgi:hypothetical protein